MSQHLERLVRVVEAATDMAPEQRQSFFERELGDEPELLPQASRLLHLHTTDMLSTDPAVRSAAVRESLQQEPLKVSGDRLGPYRVVDVLGEGGMGRVYLAERDDGEVERRVAIKVISGRKSGPLVHRRFLAERQILAGLDHANIARMFDAGTTDDGRSFLVMEPVDGLPIDQFCVEHGYTLRQRLGLFEKVAAAVSHAHQRLVVHRDLKPSNILVDKDGEPKLLDFGIAKLVDPSTGMESSRTGPAMTPKWASPEQLRGEVITTATDVYSLGLLLYKLVTGRLPHDPDISLADLARRTFEKVEPPRPSHHLENPEASARAAWPEQDLKKVRRGLLGDLDNIILKALRHDPAERYKSVEALIDDLRRLEAGEPVTATRETFFYVAKKFIGRHRWPVAMAAMMLTFAAVFVGYQEQQSRIVREEARRTEIANAFLADLFGDAEVRTRAGKRVDLKSMLDAGVERIRNEEIKDPRVRAQILATLGKSYSDLSLWSEALNVLEEAEQLFRELGLKRPLAEVLILKGSALQSTSEFEAAQKAMIEARSLGFAELESRIETENMHLTTTRGEIGETAARAYAKLVEVPKKRLPLKPDELSQHIYLWAASLANSGHFQVSHHYMKVVFRIEMSNEVSDMLLAIDGLGRFLRVRQRWKECAQLYDLMLEVHDEGLSHQDSSYRTITAFSSGLCIGLSGAHDRGLATLEDGLRRTMELLEKSPNDIRARYHVGLGHQYRARIYEAIGEIETRDADLQVSREIFERLLQDHDDIIFIHNAYAMTLMMQGDIDKAKPVVERLVWQGWRRQDFFDMAKAAGALPDFVPPRLELETELPPKIRAYIDSLPEAPLPWEDGFRLEDWRRPQG